MTAYSNSDAARDLRPALDKAPIGAVNGEWFFITEQAGVSSQYGGYMYADGSHVTAGDHVFRGSATLSINSKHHRYSPLIRLLFAGLSLKYRSCAGALRLTQFSMRQ